MAKYENIFGSWYEVMLPFLNSKEFESIGKAIKAEKETVYPELQYIFRAFKLCPYEKLKIVILTTNVFVNGESDGLAFSCGWEHLGLYKRPVQDIIFDAIEIDVANGLYLDRNPDLKRWAKQGILLLNCDLTTLKGKPGSHIKLWRPFINYVIQTIVDNKIGIIFNLMGPEANRYASIVDNPNHDWLTIEHPMKALVEKRQWVHASMFSYMKKVSDFIHSPNQIQWT